MNHIPESLAPIVNIDGVDRYRPPMEEVRGLAWNIGSRVMRSSFKIERLVAVTRGGLSVTDCLSRALNIRDIQTLAIELYDENNADGNPEIPGEDIKVYREPDLPNDGEGTLFGDDVLDTGATVNYIRQRWPRAAIGVAYTKQPHAQTLETVDFYGRYVGNVWIDFPWEVESQARKDLLSGSNGIVL